MKKYIDANLDAPDNTSSGILNPHQRCLQAKVKYCNEPKQVMPKREDLSRSLEKNGHLIQSFQLFSINHAHILLSSLQLNTEN